MRALICLLLFALPAAAQQRPPLRESRIAGMPKVQKQKGPVWCWAAGMQNVLAYYKVERTQAQISQATYGKVVNLPLFKPMQAVPAFLEIQKTAGIAPKGKVIHPYVASSLKRFGANNLIREIVREKSPVLLFHRFANGTGHVVVCDGIRYRGNRVISVWIQDPGNAKRLLVDAVEMANRNEGVIQVRVAPRPPKQFRFRNQTLTVRWDYVVPGHGRVWYSNETKAWHFIHKGTTDAGPIK